MNWGQSSRARRYSAAAFSHTELEANTSPMSAYMFAIFPFT